MLRDYVTGKGSSTFRIYDTYQEAWTGEVGRLVFSRFQPTPREFMWSLHHDPDQPQVKKASRLTRLLHI
jgi:hypothetical protein